MSHVTQLASWCSSYVGCSCCAKGFLPDSYEEKLLCFLNHKEELTTRGKLHLLQWIPFP